VRYNDFQADCAGRTDLLVCWHALCHHILGTYACVLFDLHIHARHLFASRVQPLLVMRQDHVLLTREMVLLYYAGRLLSFKGTKLVSALRLVAHVSHGSEQVLGHVACIELHKDGHARLSAEHLL